MAWINALELSLIESVAFIVTGITMMILGSYLIRYSIRTLKEMRARN